MNPFYNGTAKKSVGKNPDVPTEMQEEHPGTGAPMTEQMGGVTFDNSLGKELTQ